eukprot:TRINITY_DN42232_c0_g3_i2.p1 TRINITY_DN42232_c0_g3~~TRINITY_DN42232_c0_g3_i2.p1  ORF type:complete len:511 (+),score=53.58 TRINITY_DN42232_c0_g3_i2:191-1534(+)
MYKNVQFFNLIGNYRSQQFIVDASYKLNKLSDNQIPGQIPQISRRTNVTNTGKIIKERCATLRAEADVIAQYVKKQTNKGVKPGQISILYRYHKQGNIIIETLRTQGIQAYQHGAYDLWKRKEVKFFRHILQLLINFRSSALDAVYSSVARGFGSKSYKKLKDFQEQFGDSVNDVLLGDIRNFQLPDHIAKQIFEQTTEFHEQNEQKLIFFKSQQQTLSDVQILWWEELNQRVLDQIPEFQTPDGIKFRKSILEGINKLRTFYVILRNLVQFCGDLDGLNYVILHIFDQIQFFKDTEDISAQERRQLFQQALKSLNYLMKQQIQNNQYQFNFEEDIFDVLEILDDLISQQLDTLKDPDNFVNLMTIHASKGLEFDTVVICGLNEGFFPKDEEGEDFFEEIRLFYVAITRAKNDLLLTCSLTGTNQIFGNYTKTISNQASMFHTLKYQ